MPVRVAGTGAGAGAGTGTGTGKPSNGSGNGSASASANPSGMVIHAQYAKEAILDPTWLDSDEDEDEYGETDHDHYINDSLLSVNGSVSASASVNGSVSVNGSHTCSTSSVGMGMGFEEYPRSPSHSRGLSIGSLSVGSCGLGKISISCFSDGVSLSGSEGSHGHGHGHGHNRFTSTSTSTSVNTSANTRRIHLNHVDIVDMGVESVSSHEHENSSHNDHVLDYLYDLDRRDYDLSDGDDDGDGDGEDDMTAGCDGDGGGDGEEEYRSMAAGVDEDSAYLPHYLISPPRLTRRNDNDNEDENGDGNGDGDVEHDCQLSVGSEYFSIASEEEHGPNGDGGSTADADVIKFKSPMPMPMEGGSTSPTTIDTINTADETTVVSPSPPPQARMELDMDELSTSSSVETNLLSNCAPSAPTNLNEDSAGIMAGDMILSILDCPGSRTRKKRSTRKAARKDTIDNFQWGAHATSSAISCMRSLRKAHIGIEIPTDELLQASSLAPGKTTTGVAMAWNQGNHHDNDDDTEHVKPSTSGEYDCNPSKTSPHSTRSIASGPRSPHRSQNLDTMALDLMKVSLCCATYSTCTVLENLSFVSQSKSHFNVLNIYILY